VRTDRKSAKHTHAFCRPVAEILVQTPARLQADLLTVTRSVGRMSFLTSEQDSSDGTVEPETHKTVLVLLRSVRNAGSQT
jgi:hypothetical protein